MVPHFFVAAADEVVVQPLETLTHFGVVQDGNDTAAYVTEDDTGKMVLAAYNQDLVDSDLEEEADVAGAKPELVTRVSESQKPPTRKRQKIASRPVGRPPSGKRHWTWNAQAGRYEAPAGGTLDKWLQPQKLA